MSSRSNDRPGDRPRRRSMVFEPPPPIEPRPVPLFEVEQGAERNTPGLVASSEAASSGAATGINRSAQNGTESRMGRHGTGGSKVCVISPDFTIGVGREHPQFDIGMRQLELRKRVSQYAAWAMLRPTG